VTLQRGTVVRVALDPTVDQEQRGARPCVVVSDPAVTEDQRYPMLCVVPVTATPGEGALYPQLTPGPSGLRKLSFALVDQIRAVDKRRVTSIFGTIRPSEQEAVDEGICLFLGLVPLR